ncbi:MAG: IgGFc-binding protein [Kofleriaceae bacterium]
MRLACLFALTLIACGPSNRPNPVDPDAAEPACSTGNHRCNGSTYEVCNAGVWSTQDECPVACADGLGCVECQPGGNVCQDGNVHACDASGHVGGQVTACTGSDLCSGGACVDACADAAMKRSYVGCEYWAVDLDNAVEVLGVQGSSACSTPGAKRVTRRACANSGLTAVAGLCDPPNEACPSGYTCQDTPICILDAQGSPFAVVVSNPQPRAVDVTVTAGTGQSFTQSVPAGQVAALLPQMNGIPDQSVDGTGTESKAYKVVAQLPIVAYQFNPLDNVNVFSNDASLLIPRTAYDVEYHAMSWPTTDRRPQNHAYHGYVSIVAHEDNTVIEVTPTAAVRASATQPAIAANTATQFTLAAHEVLTLQAAGSGDLTGTKVRSVNGTTTFGVFGGHEAMGFGEMSGPSGYPSGPCCADHIEEMLFPTSTWGKTFAIARSQSRGTNEPDLLRIMAQKPNTQVTFDPPPIGTCGTLQPGKFCQVKIQGDTAITSNEPILIGHYLESAIWQSLFGGSIGEGDPDLALAVPTEQFRTEYTILVPNAYAKNFISIAAGPSGVVRVDGLAVQTTPFANGAYRSARQRVNAGQHKISCPDGCGVLVYGYADAVSYMFAGGLDLKQIVIE